MMGTATLALVVPVHNDQEGLCALLQQVAQLDCFDQVVIGDDGSDPPVTLDVVPQSLRDRTEILRSDISGGAGQARNRAMAAVRCSHQVFFDSDDLFTDDFAPLWRQVQGLAFDFCLFKHNDSRRLAHGDCGPMAQDRALWHLAGVSASGLQRVTGQAAAYLAETANYPWNKIYQHDFLRRHGLRFSEIPVHNDIMIHWHSFSCAADILVSDRIAATHFVAHGSQRLTNRKTADRLRVFEPLVASAEMIRSRQGSQSALMLSLLRFSCGLIPWIRGNLAADQDWGQELDRRTAEFLAQELAYPGMFDWVSRTDPVLIHKMLAMMALAQREQETC